MKRVRDKSPLPTRTPNMPVLSLSRSSGLAPKSFGQTDENLPEPEPQKVKMSPALESLLVYTIGVKCRGINQEEEYAPEHIFSLSENAANKIIKQDMTHLIKHNRSHLIRIYPNGLRVNSTNYEPHRYWSAGAQLVALNWQTFGSYLLDSIQLTIDMDYLDVGYMINHAMFQRNGQCGYVLKPSALRLSDNGSLSKRTNHFLDVTVSKFSMFSSQKHSAIA